MRGNLLIRLIQALLGAKSRPADRKNAQKRAETAPQSGGKPSKNFMPPRRPAASRQKILRRPADLRQAVKKFYAALQTCGKPSKNFTPPRRPAASRQKILRLPADLRQAVQEFYAFPQTGGKVSAFFMPPRRPETAFLGRRTLFRRSAIRSPLCGNAVADRKNTASARFADGFAARNAAQKQKIPLN